MSEGIQYWLVGANWDGDDQAAAFYRRGYWAIGWSDQQQPEMAQLRDSIRAGDRVAVKSMRGRGSPTITIKGLGIVKEVGPDKRIYITWLVTGLDREIDSHGCYASIHGPYSPARHDPWISQVFRI